MLGHIWIDYIEKQIVHTIFGNKTYAYNKNLPTNIYGIGEIQYVLKLLLPESF